MKTAYWLSAAVAIAALGFMATSAPAASLNGIGSLKTAASETSDVRNVHWRRGCWRHRGHWHCRRYARHWYPRYYYGGDPYYYGGYPYYYRRYHHGPRFGIWGPGFGFHIGPRRHYWW